MSGCDVVYHFPGSLPSSSTDDVTKGRRRKDTHFPLLPSVPTKLQDDTQPEAAAENIEAAAAQQDESAFSRRRAL